MAGESGLNITGVVAIMSSASVKSVHVIERFRNGYLHHLPAPEKRHKKAKKRWVVFQGSSESGFFQLKLFKTDSEKMLKAAYTLTKDSLVGTERGTLQSSKKSPPYWAIILNNDTLVFNEVEGGVDGSLGSSGLELKDWDDAVKEYLHSDSWLVFQLTGFTANELHLTLHVTDKYLCLATLNPPKCYKQWPFKHVLQYKARDSVFGFLIGTEDEEATPEYYEVKAESSALASRIVQTLKRKIRGINIPANLPLGIAYAQTDGPPTTQSNNRRQSSDSYDRYTPSPHSRRASSSEFPEP